MKKNITSNSVGLNLSDATLTALLHLVVGDCQYGVDCHLAHYLLATAACHHVQCRLPKVKLAGCPKQLNAVVLGAIRLVEDQLNGQLLRQLLNLLCTVDTAVVNQHVQVGSCSGCLNALQEFAEVSLLDAALPQKVMDQATLLGYCCHLYYAPLRLLHVLTDNFDSFFAPGHGLKCFLTEDAFIN